MPKLPILPDAASRPFDVVAFGENSLDFVGAGPRPPAGLDKTALTSFGLLVGGQATTAAVAVARQGLRARYVGAFGSDEWGTTVRATLERERVDLVAIERPGARSRVAVVLVDTDSGDRTVFEYRDPALSLDAGAIPLDALLSGRVLLLDATDLQTSTAAARAARNAGVRTIIDVDRVTPAVRDLLREIDIIVVPHAFLMAWTGLGSAGAALAALYDEFKPSAAVVTLGPDGSLALAGGCEIATPGFRIEAVDTTGAGDAFRAGLASGWVRLGNQPDLADVLEVANATAALNCCAIGAQGGLPTVAEIERLVTRAGRDQSK